MVAIEKFPALVMECVLKKKKKKESITRAKTCSFLLK